MSNQKQSRLELYVEVLKTLGEAQALNFKAIQGKTNTDRSNLAAAIKFLQQQDLVQPQTLNNNITYKNTTRGIRVFKYLADGRSSEATPGGKLIPIQQNL